MFDSDPTEFAVKTARGFDLFERQDDPHQKRATYHCLGSIPGTDPHGPVSVYDRGQAKSPEALQALAMTAQSDPVLNTPLTLADTDTWPNLADGGDALVPLLYLDFFRSRQIADMAAQRFQAGLGMNPARVLADPGTLPGSISPLYQFNLLARAAQITPLLLAGLQARIEQGPVPAARADQAAYGLRMLGDLLLRAQDPHAAHGAFSMGCALSDNPHRRRKAIEAAQQAGLTDARDAHITAFEAQWALPDDLMTLKGSGAST